MLNKNEKFSLPQIPKLSLPNKKLLDKKVDTVEVVEEQKE